MVIVTEGEFSMKLIQLDLCDILVFHERTEVVEMEEFPTGAGTVLISMVTYFLDRYYYGMLLMFQ